MPDDLTNTVTSPTTTPPARRHGSLRRTARWMVTFAGFPLGGLSAMLLVGPVHSPGTALAGGLLTGVVLGVVQAWGLGRQLDRRTAVSWTAATAIGLTGGLGIGAAAVGYATSLTALALQGAVSGLLVGAAQAVVLRGLLGRRALALPPALAAIWAIGWTVTTLGGIQVEQQFTVFGSFGALTVTALTAVLPQVLHRIGRTAS